MIDAQCPYCGEVVEVDVDEQGASSELYVEDCSVCCRPWNVHVTRGEDGVEVRLERDDE